MSNSRQHKTVLLLLCTALCLIFHLQWIVPAAIAAGPSATADQIEIRVRPNNYVTGTRMTLKDIADITAGSFLKQAIEGIDMGSSPDPNQIRVMEKHKIAYLLKGERFLPEDAVLICPDTVYVKRLGQTVDKTQIEAFVSDRIKNIFPKDLFVLEQLRVRGLESYPKGDLSYSTDESKLVGKNGRIAGYVSVMVDDVPVDRVNISGKVAVFKRVVFAARTLPKGQVLERNDFHMKKVNIFDFNTTLVNRLDDVQGKILQSGLKKDDYLKASNLSQPPMIKKGDLITLVASHRSLKIVTTGISVEDGFKNDLIKVENIHSGKLVRGVVKEKFKVEVVY